MNEGSLSLMDEKIPLNWAVAEMKISPWHAGTSWCLSNYKHRYQSALWFHSLAGDGFSALLLVAVCSLTLTKNSKGFNVLLCSNANIVSQKLKFKCFILSYLSSEGFLRVNTESCMDLAYLIWCLQLAMKTVTSCCRLATLKLQRKSNGIKQLLSICSSI